MSSRVIEIHATRGKDCSVMTNEPGNITDLFLMKWKSSVHERLETPAHVLPIQGWLAPLNIQPKSHAPLRDMLFETACDMAIGHRKPCIAYASR